MCADEERARTAVLCAIRTRTRRPLVRGDGDGATSEQYWRGGDAGAVASGSGGTHSAFAFATAMLVSIEDSPKPDARLAVALLRRYLKRDVVLMSGDNRRTATAVARYIGINKVL